MFHIFDRETSASTCLEATRSPRKPPAAKGGGFLSPKRAARGARREELSVDEIDFSKKILHAAWHPSENLLAVAATNNLFIFQQEL